MCVFPATMEDVLMAIAIAIDVTRHFPMKKKKTHRGGRNQRRHPHSERIYDHKVSKEFVVLKICVDV